MNPYDETKSEPNFWLSCIIIDKDAMEKQTRSDREARFESEKGKSCPTEILETMAKYNAEGRPIWKPMHMQPIFKANPFVTKDGLFEGEEYTEGKTSVGADIFERGLCLPSDIKMTAEEQEVIIQIIRSCFD